MMRSIFLRTLYEKRVFIIGWMLGYAALAALLVVFFPAMSGKDALDALMVSMPEGMQGLIGDLSNLHNFDTYIAAQLFDIRSSVIVGVMAIILGLGIGVAEEERGELRTLVALPVSRISLLLQKWAALCVIALIVTVGFAVGMYVSMPFVEGAMIDHAVLWQLLGMTWLITVFVGTLTFAIGIGKGSKAWAMTVGIMVVVVSYLLLIFGGTIDWLADFGPWTPLYYFAPIEVVKTGIAFDHVTILVGAITIPLLLAVLTFRRRDIR